MDEEAITDMPVVLVDSDKVAAVAGAGLLCVVGVELMVMLLLVWDDKGVNEDGIA